uniref:Enoyl-CoA hydratase 1 n=1 Tax=Buteo japonicus TaxID=224669 RepID=A0A8C0HPL1_9AVES
VPPALLPQFPSPSDRLGATALQVPARLMLVEEAEQCLPGHSFETLQVMLEQDHVLHVELHHPEKRIAVNMAFWSPIRGKGGGILTHLERTGRIDLMGMGSEFMMVEGEDRARKAWNLCRKICEYQETFSVLEKCPKPVIAAVHGACVGAGVDLISACDIRYCAQDAWFQEVDIGLVADVGTLQHLPKIMGSWSLVNELAFTTHKMMAPEVQSSSLVSRVFADKEMLLQRALEAATTIAARSSVAVQGTKVNLLCSWDHPVPKSLRYVATWNMSMLQTEDILKSVQVAMEKKGPEDVPFSKL